jgi:hypothetical protein
LLGYEAASHPDWPASRRRARLVNFVPGGVDERCLSGIMRVARTARLVALGDRGGAELVHRVPPVLFEIVAP